MALVHGIGATEPERWAEQSADALVKWWTGMRRSVRAGELPCPAGCELALGHRHLLLAKSGRAARVDLEPLFWAGCVKRPGRLECAWLVLQSGLLIGLVDVLAAGLSALEQLPEAMEGYRAMTRVVWRLLSWFGRALVVPPLTTAFALAVLLAPGVRKTLGDAFAWSTNEASHARVTQQVLGALRRNAGGSTVLVGHSQGGSILAELEPQLRESGGDLRLLTLGSGHGLLTAVSKLLPEWSPLKSLVAWTALLAYSSLALAAILTATLTLLRPVVPFLAAPFKSGAAMWLMQSVPTRLTESLLREGGHFASLVQGSLTKPFQLPPHLLPVELAGTLVAGLIVLFAVKPARLLHRLIGGTEAKGIDIVATHDLVAAAMLQLGQRDRLRRVHQCGSLIFDHTTYLKNACTVLPLLAAQVELAAGLRADAEPSEEDLALASYHDSGFALRGWTRLLFMMLAALIVGWIGVGNLPTVAWTALAVVCATAVSVATGVSSVRRLACTAARVDFDPARAAVLEQARRGRASRWWPFLLLAMAFPMVSGVVVGLSYTEVARAIAPHPGLWALTILAALVGLVLIGLAWLSLFGARHADWAVAALLVAALVWFMQGTAWGAEMGLLMVLVAAAGAFRVRRQRRRELAGRAAIAEQGGIGDR